MQYHNLLFPYGRPEERVSESLLYDLRIDAVLLKLANGPDQLKYDTCYLPLKDKESVLYRHAVFQDIMRGDLYPSFMKFQNVMNEIHFLEERMNRITLPAMRASYFLDQLLLYIQTAEEFCRILNQTALKSEGLVHLSEDLQEYIRSQDFNDLYREARGVQEALSRITYQICVRDNHISIRKADFSQTGISDLEEELNRFFGQFIGSKAEFPVTDRDGWDPDPVEAEIIKGLVRLFPEEFQGLFSLVRDRNHFVPEELIRYHEDLGFYTVWLEYIMPKQEQGLSFCFPMITDRSESFMASNCFDLILADQMLKEGRQAIRNNLILKPEEHIMVLTGPNQGGKTTFVRMLGQLFYLGALGVPVPGTVVRMFLPDHIYTHFERQEMQSSQSGKLRDDIIRIYDILKEATDRSLILINEMFASTTLADAAWLGRKILKQISQIGAICLYVTFINELSSFLPGTVSLISEIGEDMEERTYKISRAHADGKAYARSMAEKYSLTRESIRERIGAGS